MSDGPTPPPRPQPRNIEQPSGLVPERLVLSAEPIPLDTNENGYYDTFTVTVYLFAEETRYPLPIHVDGSLAFTLSDPSGKAVAAWSFTPAQVERMKILSATGLAGYASSLSIAEVTDDRMPTERGSLTAVFTPSDTSMSPVRSRGSATVRVGRTGVH